MTSLQLFILSTLHQRGPQSVMGLWSHSRSGESLKAVFIETGKLADDNFIERAPTHNIPQRYPVAAEAACNASMQWWQLTQKGQEHIAALGSADVAATAACNATPSNKKEVCLGSK